MSDQSPGDMNSATHEHLTVLFRAFMNPECPDHFVFASPDYGKSVVQYALQSREQVSEEAQRALNSAIHDSGVRVDGFQNAERAPTFRLQEPVFRTTHLSDSLAGAVLRVWAEANNSLHDAVVTHLEDQDLPTLGLDFPEERFRGVWDFDTWQRERDRIVQFLGDQYDRDDVALMLCYVSGNMPAPLEGQSPEASPSMGNREVLSTFLDYLRLLPPNDPEWERGIPEFVQQVDKIIKTKEVARHQATKLEAGIVEIRNTFSDEFNYLEQRIDFWSAALFTYVSSTSHALQLVAELKGALEEYRPIRKQAPVRSEEQVRAAKRKDLESSILSIVERIRGLMSGEDGPDSPAPQSQLSPDAEPEEHGPSSQSQGRNGPAGDGMATGELDGGTEPEPESSTPGPGDNSAINTGAASTVSELSDTEIQPAENPVVTESVLSEEDCAALQLENQELKQDVGYLKEEVESLRSDLHDSRTMEEYWRLAYQKEQQGSEDSGKIELFSIEDVNSAVKQARQKFSRQLLFPLNSESNVEDNPFNTPQTVWEALQWLATTYHQSRTGKLREPNLDRSIREACGWWYKSDQHNTTMGRYRNSYTTKVDGKTYWLKEHIGTGTNRDARYTIRIAFNWDRARQKVVVGYIGRHQRTDAS